MNTLSIVLVIAIPSMLAILAIIIGLIVGINRAKKNAPREMTVTDYQTLRQNLKGKPAWVLLTPQNEPGYFDFDGKNSPNIKHFDLSAHNRLFSECRQGQLIRANICLPRGVNYMKAEFVNNYNPDHVRRDGWTEYTAWPTGEDKQSPAIHILVETLSPASARGGLGNPKTDRELSGFIKTAKKKLTEQEKKAFSIVSRAYAKTHRQRPPIATDTLTPGNRSGRDSQQPKMQSGHTHPAPYLYYRSTEDLSSGADSVDFHVNEANSMSKRSWQESTLSNRIYTLDGISVLPETSREGTPLEVEYFYRVIPNSALHKALKKLVKTHKAKQIDQACARPVEANNSIGEATNPRHSATFSGDQTWRPSSAERGNFSQKINAFLPQRSRAHRTSPH